MMFYAWKSSTQEAEVGHCCIEFEDIEFEDILVNPGVQVCLNYSLKPCLKTTTNPGSGPSLFVFVVNLKVASRKVWEPDFYQKTSRA